jgi:uncharacterized membrane protein HdeD (DUF308 family)
MWIALAVALNLVVDVFTGYAMTDAFGTYLSIALSLLSAIVGIVIASL